MSAWLALWFGCSAGVPTCDTEIPHAVPEGTRENLVVLLLDDIGLDKTSTYGLHPQAPLTPTMDALSAEGMRFDRAYAAPTCSPTRASLLTGRHPSRHGIGRWIDPKEEDTTLADDEVTIAELLQDAGYATAAVGKWHLSSFDGHGAAFDPQRQGFDRFLGILGNPNMAMMGDGTPRGYAHWEQVVDGQRSFEDGYLTTRQVDDALLMAATLPEPWFLYVAFSAAHSPWDPPPSELAQVQGGGTAASYAAVVRALDAELGRFLDGLGDKRDRTMIVTMGDNGTPHEVVLPPWDPVASKDTVSEGGVRVPMWVTGPHVAAPGTTSSALVHVVDVFATLADVAGIDLAAEDLEVDGRSWLPGLRSADEPGRRCVYVERFTPNGRVRRADVHDRAVVDRSRKVLRREGEEDASFGVVDDPSGSDVRSQGTHQDLVGDLDAFDRLLRR